MSFLSCRCRTIYRSSSAHFSLGNDCFTVSIRWKPSLNTVSLALSRVTEIGVSRIAFVVCAPFGTVCFGFYFAVRRQVDRSFSCCAGLSDDRFVYGHELRASYRRATAARSASCPVTRTFPERLLSSSAWMAPPAVPSFDARIAVSGDFRSCNACATRM